MGGILIVVLWLTVFPVAVFVGGMVWTMLFGHFAMDAVDDASESPS